MKKNNNETYDGKEPLAPLNDIVFAKMFENLESAEALKHFINAVLRNAGEILVDEIVEVKSEYVLLGELIDETRLGGKTGVSRGGRVDVKAKADDGRLFGVEMQLYEEPLMVDRSLFYSWLMVRDEFPAGRGYDDIPVTILINILKVGIRKDPAEYHNVIGMAYLNGSDRETASDRIRIHSIELDAFEALFDAVPTGQLPELGIWLRYMTSGYKSEKEEREMIDLNRELEAFAERYHFAADDPKLREKYELIMSGIRDEQTRLNRARREGMEKGMKKGLQQGVTAGQNRMSELIQRMSEAGEADRLAQLSDDEFLQKMFKKYQI